MTTNTKSTKITKHMTIINSNIAENIHTHAKIVQQNTQTEQKRQKS